MPINHLKWEEAIGTQQSQTSTGYFVMIDFDE
jgi:hypothetical protein